MSTPHFADLTEKTEVHTAQFAVSRSDLVRYAGASGDFNPIHWSQSTAQAVGLPDVIAHGMYTLALAGRAVAQWCGDTGRINDISARFTKPVVVPDGKVATVDFVITVAKLDDTAKVAHLTIKATCAGAGVLGKARAEVAFS